MRSLLVSHRSVLVCACRAMRKLMMDTVNMDDADRRRLQAPRIRFGPEDGDGDDGSNG